MRFRMEYNRGWNVAVWAGLPKAWGAGTSNRRATSRAGRPAYIAARRPLVVSGLAPRGAIGLANVPALSIAEHHDLRKVPLT